MPSRVIGWARDEAERTEREAEERRERKQIKLLRKTTRSKDPLRRSGNTASHIAVEFTMLTASLPITTLFTF